VAAVPVDRRVKIPAFSSRSGLGNHRTDHNHRSTAPPQPGPGYRYWPPEGARRMARSTPSRIPAPAAGSKRGAPHHQPRRLSPATEVPGPGRTREPRARRPGAPPERSDSRSTTVRSIWVPGPPTGWPAVTRRSGHGRCRGSADHAGPRPRRPAADPLPHSPRGPEPHVCRVWDRDHDRQGDDRCGGAGGEPEVLVKRHTRSFQCALP
jgi:hypothetical protein